MLIAVRRAIRVKRASAAIDQLAEAQARLQMAMETER